MSAPEFENLLHQLRPWWPYVIGAVALLLGGFLWLLLTTMRLRRGQRIFRISLRVGSA